MSTTNVNLNGDMSPELLKAIEEAMQGVDFNSVDPDATAYSDIKDGYYLVSLKKYEFGFSKKSQRLQVMAQFKVEENGFTTDVDKYNQIVINPIKGSKGKVTSIFYNYESEDKILKFANDMSKFESETPGESLLGKEAFMNGVEILLDSLNLLVQSGSRVYLKQETTTNADGTTSTWKNLVSWNTAKKLGLPM